MSLVFVSYLVRFILLYIYFLISLRPISTQNQAHFLSGQFQPKIRPKYNSQLVRFSANRRKAHPFLSPVHAHVHGKVTRLFPSGFRPTEPSLARLIFFSTSHVHPACPKPRDPASKISSQVEQRMLQELDDDGDSQAARSS